MKKNFVFFYLIFLVGIALISGTALSKTFQETRLSQQAMHCSEIFSVFSQFYSKDSDQGSSFFKAIDIFTDVVLKELRLPVSNDRLEAMALQRSEAAKILLSNRSMQMTNLREDAVMCGAWADGFLSQGTRYQYVPVYPKVVAPDIRSKYQVLFDEAFSR